MENEVMEFLMKYGEGGAIIAIVVYCARWIIKEITAARALNDTNQSQFITDLQKELENLRNSHKEEVEEHRKLRTEFNNAIRELNKVRIELHACAVKQRELQELVNTLTA